MNTTELRLGQAAATFERVKGMTVAAVQAVSENGAARQNLTGAARLVREAAAAGAELIVCPEFLATGYEYDERIWERAEPAGGATEHWLAELAGGCGVYIGAGYLEADGDQFYNTFSLFGPDGTLAGRVRKASLPFCEGWYFAPSDESKIIDTEIGRIAVGICNDNQTAWFYRHLAEQAPDLLLMPHSAPTPRLPVVAGAFRRQLAAIGEFYARQFGIPVVYTNKAASGTNWTPVPILPVLRVPLLCEGGSAIYGAGGEKVARRDDSGAGVVIGQVELDPAAKRHPADPPAGYWAREPDIAPGLAGRAFDVLARMGHRGYIANFRRGGVALSKSRPEVT
ncbi:carbon-nitrogen hydrolase family protein [Nocardia carnea]|uniref:Carbon-nitrogen hydrolase family protein n=1 Tax=Nocardia carnea TaxID=37328 RepID=A0ABW7TMT6_9NOCA|nr:carbon-nitrogen hydrolase family protein [Nocardia carnea]